MLRFIIARFFQAVVALLCILTLTFFLNRLAPGSPFQDERAIPEHILEKTKAYYGLDEPLIVQWAISMFNVARGDFGPSFGNFGYSVNEIIAQGFPVSLAVGMGGLLIALTIGIPFGVISAARRNTAVDYSLMSIALVGICLPTFVSGPALAAFFGLHLRWFNAMGWNGPTDWVLPSLTLGIYYAAYVARLSRGGILETLSQDYVRTARAKGLPEWRVLLVHTLKGGLLPVVNFLGPAIAGLISGSFVVETVFQLPGLGKHFIHAAVNRDYTLILGTVTVFAILILVLNLIVDVIQIAMNPRLRSSRLS